MEAALPTLPQSQLRLADLPTRRPTDFALAPTADERAAVADALGIVAIKKLRFTGQLIPTDRTDWTLQGDLGATVVQDCVVTLAPVSTRIDESVIRHFVADMPEATGTEVEMPEDDTVEPLPSTIDLAHVMIEALSLALPLYPRVPDADTGNATATPAGADPITDQDTKPFSGLQGLRDALEKKDD